MMASVASKWAVSPDSTSWQPLLRRWWPCIAVMVAAFVIRAPTFGNPELGFDEQLYLLIGDRLLHGHLPYVEFWDRKPLGLFLFYAGVRAFGGTGIVQYQVAATLCAGVTACLIWALARRSTGQFGAIVAAIAYILLLIPFHGTGGQSPVIYNAMTAVAALAAFRANDTESGPRIFRLALLNMAMMGMAIQFKYTPFVEGIFFGAFFLWRFYKIGLPVGHILAAAATMIFVALLPTILVITFYAASGHLDAFLQANILSIFHRNPFPAKTRHDQYGVVLGYGACVIGLAPFALAQRWRSRNSGKGKYFGLIVGWLAAALAGFGMLGDFYDFYFITVLLPLCIFIAPIFHIGRAGFGAACLMLSWPLVSIPDYFWQMAQYRQATDQLVLAIKPYVRNNSLYVYDGPTILYLLTDTNPPTRYIYPDHLINPTEAPALGSDPATEETRLLQARPGAIVTANLPVIPQVNPVTQRLVQTALATNYVLASRVPLPDRTYYVWARRDLHPAASSIHDPMAAIPF